MYAARSRKPTGFSSDRNTWPAIASGPGPPGVAESAPLIICLLHGCSSRLRPAAARPPGFIISARVRAQPVLRSREPDRAGAGNRVGRSVHLAFAPVPVLLPQFALEDLAR